MSPEEFDKVAGTKIQTLLRELLTHLRKTERASEELEKIRANLEETRGEYTDLYEFAPVASFIHEKNPRMQSEVVYG